MDTKRNLETLNGLRGQVLDSLTGMTDQLVGDDSMGFDALIAIARSTGRSEFLVKAYEQCQKMPDSPDKANALLDLLDEIEVHMAVLNEPEQSGGGAAGEQPVSDDNQSDQSQNQNGQ